LNIPEEFGGTEVDYVTFARIFAELSRGWLGLAGIIGTHLVLADVLGRFGTDDQKRRFLLGLATGERRGGICLSESNAGTDLQNIATTARRDGAVYRVNGSKMWITNARNGNTFLLLAKTDPASKPVHRGMSAFVIEKGAPGLTVNRDIDKLGYKTVETCELHFDNFPVPVENLIGGVEGEGFEEAIKYAQQRVTFGKPIAQHQLIQAKLAEMATKIEASRLLIESAAEKKNRGERCDLEAGMAKLFATETAAEVSFDAMRILGGNGYSKDFPVERFYRDAPLVVIGGGTNELQKLIIARRLLEKYKV